MSSFSCYEAPKHLEHKEYPVDVEDLKDAEIDAIKLQKDVILREMRWIGACWAGENAVYDEWETATPKIEP